MYITTIFFQGFNLIFDFNGRLEGSVGGEGCFGFKSGIRCDTYGYGIGVLIINWLPGLVAVIHILAFHR